MNLNQRVANLFDEAQRIGCDTPTEAMVVDMVNHALDEQWNDLIYTLREDFPLAAKAVENWKELALSRKQQEEQS